MTTDDAPIPAVGVGPPPAAADRRPRPSRSARCSPPAASRRRGRAGPGRLRPAATPLPTVEVERRRVPAHGDLDRVHDRSTCTARSPSSGALDAAAQALVDRLDRRPPAPPPRRLAELTTEAGGEPYECANAWYMERVDRADPRPHRRRRGRRTSRRATTRRATCSSSSTAWSRWRRRCTSSSSSRSPTRSCAPR